MKTASVSVAGVFVWALIAGYGSAQEAGPRLPAQLDEEQDLHAEMARLIREIERKLIAIDAQLGDAGAGEAPDGVEEPGVFDLLSASRADSGWVVTAIDRVFEIRRHHRAASGGT